MYFSLYVGILKLDSCLHRQRDPRSQTVYYKIVRSRCITYVSLKRIRVIEYSTLHLTRDKIDDTIISDLHNVIIFRLLLLIGWRGFIFSFSSDGFMIRKQRHDDPSQPPRFAIKLCNHCTHYKVGPNRLYENEEVIFLERERQAGLRIDECTTYVQFTVQD